MDSNDDVVLPESMRQVLYDRYPNVKLALLKKGGDFPFLAYPEVVTMHLQVHLRSNGLYPDLHRTIQDSKREQKEEEEKDEKSSVFLKPQMKSANLVKKDFDESNELKAKQPQQVEETPEERQARVEKEQEETERKQKEESKRLEDEQRLESERQEIKRQNDIHQQKLQIEK